MTDFDYKKYSLEHLENWLHDAISSADASPQEIYDVIKNVVKEQYDYYNEGASRTNELLQLLNGHTLIHFDVNDNISNSIHYECGIGNTSNYCVSAWNNFWDDTPNTIQDKKHDAIYGDKHSQDYVDFDEKKLPEKWVVPVEEDLTNNDLFITFPQDLLKKVGWKEGDQLEWKNNNDGTFTLHKVVTRPLRMDEC